jgi:diaminopimelate decarboxylase
MAMTRIGNFIQSSKLKQKEPFCAYIYDLLSLQQHASQAVAALPSSCELFYAIKANPETPILENLASIVHGFEVASLGEIEKVRAVDTKIPILFGGPGKTDGEIIGAIQHRVQLLHVESLHELLRVEYIAAQMKKKVSILLRVNLRGPLPTAVLQMAGMPTQFGIDETELPAAIALCLQCDHLVLKGFHFHSLSNDVDAEGHARLVAYYINRVKAWAQEFNLSISYLNVGGGIGVDYANPEWQFDWMTFTTRLKEILKEHRLPWTIIFECGRYLTAACGYYAAEVLDIKQSHGKYYSIIRGGTHHFRLPASWQHSHPFIVIPIEEWPYPFPRPSLCNRLITVAGELCTPKDLLAREAPVTQLRIGDVLLFLLAGAYGWHISHHDFLCHAHPLHFYLPFEEGKAEQVRAPLNLHLAAPTDRKTG